MIAWSPLQYDPAADLRLCPLDGDYLKGGSRRNHRQCFPFPYRQCNQSRRCNDGKHHPDFRCLVLLARAFQFPLCSHISLQSQCRPHQVEDSWERACQALLSSLFSQKERLIIEKGPFHDLAASIKPLSTRRLLSGPHRKLTN